MNLARFGFRQRPFRPTPDTQSYYPATSHEYALERLARAVEDDEGLVLLTGEPGAGKTLLAHLLLERLGGDVCTALVTNCRFTSRADLLRAVLFDLSRPHQGFGEQELRLALTEHLLEQFAAGRRTLLVFDEAQDLTADLLEELRLLGNLETGQGKAVQVLLIGQAALLDTLQQPALAALNQRLAVRLRLEALDVHESADYILHQLRTAGGRPEQVASDEAVRLLARSGRGVPRLLNQMAFQALTLAETLDAELVDVEVAIEALAVLGIQADLDDESDLPAQPRLAEADADEEAAAPGRTIVMDDFEAPDFAPRTGDPEWAAGAYVYQPPGRPAQVVYEQEPS